MCVSKWTVVAFFLLTFPLLGQDAPDDRLSLTLAPGEATESWFSAEEFRRDLKLSGNEPLPLEAFSLATMGLAKPRFSLKSLFVSDGLTEMDPDGDSGHFDLPGGNRLSYGYSLDANRPFFGSEEGLFAREAVDRMPGVDFRHISERMVGEDDSWSAWYGSSLNLANMITLDLGLNYEERKDPGAIEDQEILHHRYAVTVELTPRMRIQLAGGEFMDYTMYTTEDQLDSDALLLGSPAPALTLDDLFHGRSLEKHILALELDITKQSTVRLEGYDGSTGQGMNLWLRRRSK